MILLLFVFILVLSVLVGMFAARRRNRSGFGYFLLAILISPLLAFLILLALPTFRDRRWNALRSTPPAPQPMTRHAVAGVTLLVIAGAGFVGTVAIIVPMMLLP